MKRGIVIFFIASLTAHADEQIEFFEKHIRPVLAQECYECHSTATKAKGGLLLDTRLGWEEGGDSGAVIVRGDPGASLLLKSIRHEIADLKMPKAGGRLGDEVIADFAKWIADGAVDPRDAPPSAAELAEDTSWDAVAERRSQWWSFRPITNPKPPEAAAWSEHPVDRFLAEAWHGSKLEPSTDADAMTVLRRLHYVVTGLAASEAEIREFVEAWKRDGATKAVASKVDSLLVSPHFGERWARHWMDWFRYSEGHGGQGDFEIAGAFEYRDYLIRALNADVPYDQLVREHIAGDLLPQPRVNESDGIVESRIGPAHLRMVEHGFFPVDSLDELVKFTDNQIDVVTKATLGLTVSCARCHDHKFDAISHRDYHALFGIFASSRPAGRPVNTRDALEAREASLREKRAAFTAAIRQQWLAESTTKILHERLQDWSKARNAASAKPVPAKGKAKTIVARQQPVPRTSALYPWHGLRDKLKTPTFWEKLRKEMLAQVADAEKNNAAITVSRIGFEQGLPEGWMIADGTVRVVKAGELGLGVSEETAVMCVLPAGLFSASTTSFEEAAIHSPDFTIADAGIALRWTAAGLSWARLVPNNFPMANSGSGIYGQNDVAADAETRWRSWDVSFWKKERGYLHVMTDRAASGRHTLRANDDGTSDDDEKTTRGSWWNLSEIRHLKSPKDAIQETAFPVLPLLETDTAPTNAAELAAHYASTLQRLLLKLDSGTLTEAECAFLTDCLNANLLRSKTAHLDEKSLAALTEYRSLENELPPVRVAPGVIESAGFDQALYVRGDPKQPADAVPRGFLTSLGGEPFALGHETGRLQLAQEITRADSPLFARVIANRLWHHVFGSGLVSTTDNFGHTGQKPTHPELLDHLATQMKSKHWSLKAMLRDLLTTRTFRLSSAPTAAAVEIDPANHLLTHAPLRRLEGEIVRDHLLATSSQLDTALYGPSIKQVVPTTRRSLYLRVDRTRQGPLFNVFDVPMPTTTRGARDVTTTPAQSIALMNSPFVRKQADAWAQANAKTDPAVALSSLFRQAFTREPSADEVKHLNAFLTSSSLADTAHLIFNMKEFIFIP